MGDSNGKTAEERAIETLCDIRFHKSIVLPPNPTKGRLDPLRVAYSDYGYQDPEHPESEAVVLFCGPLMGGRFTYAQLDDLLIRNRVRIIHPDRPGIGGSDPVKLQDRISTWLELIPYLLHHLHIPHVSLASHSGGVIYALNTILTLPHLLHPTNPYVAFFAPWVHYSHSGVGALSMVKYLPSPLIGKFGALTRFVNNNIIPVVGYSGNLFNALKHSSPAALPPLVPPPEEHADSFADVVFYRTMEEDALAFNAAFSKLQMSYIFAENVDGISDDAKLFLRKGANTAWCVTSTASVPDEPPHSPPQSADSGSEPKPAWTDLSTFVPLLLSHVRTNVITGELVINAFHAASDNMVGAKGQAWFDECWEDVKNVETAGRVTYRSQMGPEGTDHNWLIAERFGMSERWAQRIRRSFPVGDDEEDDG